MGQRRGGFARVQGWGSATMTRVSLPVPPPLPHAQKHLSQRSLPPMHALPPSVTGWTATPPCPPVHALIPSAPPCPPVLALFPLYGPLPSLSRCTGPAPLGYLPSLHGPPPLPHLTLSHRRARRGGIKKEHTHTHTHRRVRRGSSRKAATASICSAARAGSGGTSRPWVPPTAYLAHQAAAPLAGERTAVANALTQWQPP